MSFEHQTPYDKVVAQRNKELSHDFEDLHVFTLPHQPHSSNRNDHAIKLQNFLSRLNSDKSKPQGTEAAPREDCYGGFNSRNDNSSRIGNVQ